MFKFMFLVKLKINTKIFSRKKKNQYKDGRLNYNFSVSILTRAANWSTPF